METVSRPSGVDGDRFADAAPIGRLHTDATGRVTYANPWWCSLTGMCSEDSSDDGWFDVVHPDDLARVKAEWQSVVSEEREMSTQFRVLRSDNIELVLFMRAAPVLSEAGALVGYTVVVDDVTDRIRMQEALARSEASYRLLAEYSTDFISRHTPNGVYTYASPISETLFGYKPAELVGTSAYEYFHPEDLAEIAASHERVLEEPDISTVVYRIRCKDGSYTWFETTSRNIRDPESDEITEIIAVSRDITERRKAEEVDRLSHLLDAKDSFVASVSHELRTPLTSLVGFTEILRTEHENLTEEERNELVETLSRESTELAALIDDLLVLTRADHGTLSIVRVPINLKGQTAQVLEAMGLQHRIPINDANDDHKRALGDPIRVRQILRNLINNAITHGQDPIRINISYDAEQARFEISDAGPEIPTEQHQRIFEPYQRIHQDSGTTQSMGLGLTVSTTLAQLMEGQLDYRLASGRNTFRLSLPTTI